MKRIIAYTDGSSRGNPGNGGIGVVLNYQEHTKEISKGFSNVTNNQMELLAIAVALQSLKERCNIIVHSDSAYSINGFNKGWVENWKKNGWKNASGKAVKNPEIWRLLDILVKRHNVTFKHVKAHSGIELNEKADKLAYSAASASNKLSISAFIKDMERKL